ncbi:Glycoside-Pentoside-Hexuronide family transporter [Phytophthora megakarya]|uniref:Glycoside-Pentoside-Hexuronide family transporter n=1 Tax=Phytophthora megakarya TaxID=4795 RepID=A0A225VXI8_9STRA|nr:Glycoside-Pentoside-Hexuronide family transporter [Phytophthora megakarya]
MKDFEQGYELHVSPMPSVQGVEDKDPRSHPSIWLLLAISMPRMAVQMTWSAQWAGLGPYLSTMLPTYGVQIAQFIGPIVGAVVGPAAGVYSDRCTMKMGRRRPFLIVAGFLSIICWTVMGFTREMGEALGDHGDGADGEETDRKWTSILTVICYFIMDVTVNTVQTPAMTLVADFAGDRQTTGAALGQAWATLGALLIAAYIEFFGAAYKSLHWFMGMLSVVMFICVSVAVVFAKETPLPPSSVKPESSCARSTHALTSVYHGIRTLPKMLAVYWIAFFFIQYGYAAYNGNKGQFFGLEVYGGASANADSCNLCTEAQDAYNHGVSIAGGRADLLYNVVGYVWAWLMPFMVHKIGVKWVLLISTVPQVLFVGMAWLSNPSVDIFLVALSGITHTGWFALVVPVIIHVFGEDKQIGIYVGTLNSANCFGQLLNFAIGTGLVQTSLGYKLPVFMGGIVSFFGFLTILIFFKMKLYSM